MLQRQRKRRPIAAILLPDGHPRQPRFRVGIILEKRGRRCQRTGLVTEDPEFAGSRAREMIDQDRGARRLRRGSLNPGRGYSVGGR